MGFDKKIGRNHFTPPFYTCMSSQEALNFDRFEITFVWRQKNYFDIVKANLILSNPCGQRRLLN